MKAIEREDVWHAMSDLFLDNDMQLYEYLAVANVAAKSTYSLKELDSIFYEEVHPAFCLNLMAEAGQWTSWSRTFVVERVNLAIKNRKLRQRPRGYFARRLFDREEAALVQFRASGSCDWEKVRLLVELIRSEKLSLGQNSA